MEPPGLHHDRRLADCRLHATVKPSKVIAIGRNYAGYVKEAGLRINMQVPSDWVKVNNTMIGPTRDVVKPACVKELDDESELAVVVEKRCQIVPEEKAYDVIG